MATAPRWRYVPDVETRSTSPAVAPVPAVERDPAPVRWAVAALTAVVFGAVVAVLHALPARPAPGQPGALPTINALLNGAAFCALLGGWLAIVRHRPALHRTLMLTAFGFSSLFLVTYLLHHVQVGSVPYQGPPALRGLYFAILVPHVVLAGPVVPLALITIYRGWSGRLPAHRRLARWTLPIWAFVSLTGVAVYFMLYHLPR